MPRYAGFITFSVVVTRQGDRFVGCNVWLCSLWVDCGRVWVCVSPFCGAMLGSVLKYVFVCIYDLRRRGLSLAAILDCRGCSCRLRLRINSISFIVRDLFLFVCLVWFL